MEETEELCNEQRAVLIRGRRGSDSESWSYSDRYQGAAYGVKEGGVEKAMRPGSAGVGRAQKQHRQAKWPEECAQSRHSGQISVVRYA